MCIVVASCFYACLCLVELQHCCVICWYVHVSTNSTTLICCGFIVQLIHNKRLTRRPTCCGSVVYKSGAVDGVGLVINTGASTRLCWSQVRRRCALYNKWTAQSDIYRHLTLPVTCNNNTPILQRGRFYWQICWICMLNYANAGRNKNSQCGWICVFCVPQTRHFEVGVYKYSRSQSYDLIRRFGRHC